jgi:hypothetical protein
MLLRLVQLTGLPTRWGKSRVSFSPLLFVVFIVIMIVIVFELHDAKSVQSTNGGSVEQIWIVLVATRMSTAA